MDKSLIFVVYILISTLVATASLHAQYHQSDEKWFIFGQCYS